MRTVARARLLRLPLLISGALLGCAPPASLAPPAHPIVTPAAPSSVVPLVTPPVADSSPATSEECALLHVEARIRIERNQLDRAAAALDQGMARCAGDRGFSSEQGDLFATRGEFERAADRYIEAISGADPPEAAYQHLAKVFERLRPITRDRVRSLGSSEFTPLYVPAIGYEYAWVAAFACAGGQGRVAGQALVSGRNGQLDRLRCLCPDGTDRAIYFDFSADPEERAMRSRLGEPAEAPEDMNPTPPFGPPGAPDDRDLPPRSRAAPR